MSHSRSAVFVVTASLLSLAHAQAQEKGPLPGTTLLKETGDLSKLMLDGFEKYLLRETENAVKQRQKLWKRSFASVKAYEASIADNRRRFREIIGVVDERLPIRELEFVRGTTTPSEVAKADRYTVHAVRWPVLEGVEGEGLLLQPKGKPLARIVALPDANQTPEMLAGLALGLPLDSQWARRLAENGCQVVIPVLIDRKDTWSGDPKIWMTNVPHREWVWRPAFEVGRHIIGYEVQKVLALVDWFEREGGKIGVAGYGEGGLIAFYSAAVDTRIQSALVSGYFDSRQNLWQEPVYRNVWGLLREFGDTEIASLIVPRHLLIEHSEMPRTDGPPAAKARRRDYAAPGKIVTPASAIVRRESRRLESWFAPGKDIKADVHFISDPKQPGEVTGPGSEDALRDFLTPLGFMRAKLHPAHSPAPPDQRKDFDPSARQKRQLTQLVEHTQLLLRRSEHARREFWSHAKSGSLLSWERTTGDYRTRFHEEVIGRVPLTYRLPSVRAREEKKRSRHWREIEVVIDVLPDVFLWGYLIVPDRLKPGEQRPVVVCQHGLEGLPEDVITEDPASPGFAYYKGFAAKLADRGFVVFAPHHYYRGGNRFRQLQRIAYPLKLSLMSLTVAQHERLLEWLALLPFVDSSRIGFYGLSYGGFSSMRIPALVKGYALSINSAEFNDMALKKASVHHHYSYPFYNTYEVFEWNMANTYNYSDLAALIAPRPFMVERGHKDGVGPDEWVASEYAKVRRRYVELGIGDRTEIEFFNGPHTINGVGTFQFLHKHLKWLEPKK